MSALRRRRLHLSGSCPERVQETPIPLPPSRAGALPPFPLPSAAVSACPGGSFGALDAQVLRCARRAHRPSSSRRCRRPSGPGSHSSMWSRDTNDHGVGLQAGEFAQGRGEDQAALRVEEKLECSREDETREGSGTSVGDGKAGDTTREARPTPGRGKMARQASIQRLTNAPAASSARNRAGTATRPLASIRMAVLAGEQAATSGRPTARLVDGGWIHHRRLVLPAGREILPPSLPTLIHFGPLRGIIRPISGPSSPKSHSVCPTPYPGLAHMHLLSRTDLTARVFLYVRQPGRSSALDGRERDIGRSVRSPCPS